MSRIEKQTETDKFISTVVEGLAQMKAEEVVDIDLTNVEGAECERFIVCHGNSNTHVKAIAEGVEKEVYKTERMTCWHSDGYQNCEWVLLDYVNVIVHVFRSEFRQHYDIEQLWADANIKKLDLEK